MEEEGRTRPSSAKLDARIEARWQADMRRRSFKFLLGYVGVQLLYLAGYFLAAYFHKLNYLPLVADSLMLVMHTTIVLLIWLEARHESRTMSQGKATSEDEVPKSKQFRKLYRWLDVLLGVAMVLDAVLFAMADEVVESESKKVLPMTEIIEYLGGVPSLEGPSLPHPYKTNSVFQFHCLYMNLFVLPFKQAIIVMPMSAALYTSLVAAAYACYYEGVSLVGISPTTDRDDLVVEIGMLTLTLLFTVAAKRMLEQSQRPLFFALEYQKEEVIEEKVKRCTVEFKFSDLQERFRAIKAAKEPMVYGGADSSSLSYGPLESPTLLRPCPSLYSAMSAPPVATGLSRPRAAEGEAPACEGNGDCLPPHTYIWVEHQALPQRLSTVLPGQRVLCYDSLLRGLKYTTVLDVKTKETATLPNWVRVCLTDGTKLEMTSDHPVECYRTSGEAQSSSLGECMKAGDLQAGRDSLMVLKTVPVAVAGVQRTSELEKASLPNATVALRVQHPDRNTVFIAQGPSSRPQGMAVGSADLTPDTMLPVRVRRTFLEARQETYSMSTYSSRQTVSAPAAIGGSQSSSGIAPPRDDVIQAPPGLEHLGPDLAPPASDQGSVAFDQASLTTVEEAFDLESLQDAEGRSSFLTAMLRRFRAPSKPRAAPSAAGSTVTGSSSNHEEGSTSEQPPEEALGKEERQKLHGGRRRDKQRAKRRGQAPTSKNAERGEEELTDMKGEEGPTPLKLEQEADADFQYV